jgi:hypothetical protein
VFDVHAYCASQAFAHVLPEACGVIRTKQLWHYHLVNVLAISVVVLSYQYAVIVFFIKEIFYKFLHIQRDLLGQQSGVIVCFTAQTPGQPMLERGLLAG